MITPAFGLTAIERVLPRLALDFTTATLDPRVTFTRTTNATNPATYIDSSGAITAATNNQPRFDYDPVTLVCKGLLIEESRTNSLLNTDLLSTQIVTVTAAARTLSFYGTGSVTLSGTHTAVVSGTGAYPTRTTYTFTPTDGALTLTVSGTVQYAQLEAGAFATSYIPTTSTALTRNADVATMTGTNFSDWYNQSQGSFVLQAARYVGTGGSMTHFSVSDGTNLDAYRLYSSGSDGIEYFTGFDGGATQWDRSRSAVTSDTPFQLCATYKANAIAFALNGSAVTTDGTATIPTVDRLLFGQTGNGTAGYGRQYIRKLMYYAQALTNAETSAFSKQG